MLQFLGYNFFSVKQLKIKIQKHVSYFNVFPQHLSFSTHGLGKVGFVKEIKKCDF